VIDKQVRSVREAVADLRDGCTIMCGGFGAAGSPDILLNAIHDAGISGLTIIANNAGQGFSGLAGLIAAGRVRKVICSFPRDPEPTAFDTVYAEGRIELELVPQGTLSERIRASAAGIGAFYVRTGVGTPLAEGKEVRSIDGETYVLERPLGADVALVRARQADRWGNLVYRKAARNYNPTMAAAADLTIAVVDEVVPLGQLDPENIHTPGAFVDRIVLGDAA
jgi:3-oxoadipate CoA-transferase, alpha subunit